MEEGADALTCAALLALGVLAKETALLLPPLVFLARREREGTARALAWTLLAGLPALVIVGYQRFVWTPQIRPAALGWGLATAHDTAQLVVSEWPDVWRRLLLGGLLPLACLGALRLKAQPFLRRFGYLAVATLALPFVAWTNVASAQRVPFLGDTLQRLLLFALPLLLPLALIAVDRVWPQPSEAAPPAGTCRATRLAAGVALAVSLLLVCREVAVAGRVTAHRDLGKSMFIDVRDQAGRLQVYAQKNVLGDEQFDIFRHLDLGDFIGARGTLFTTKTGEDSIRLTAFTILAKALRRATNKRRQHEALAA